LDSVFFHPNHSSSVEAQITTYAIAIQATNTSTVSAGIFQTFSEPVPTQHPTFTFTSTAGIVTSAGALVDWQEYKTAGNFLWQIIPDSTNSWTISSKDQATGNLATLNGVAAIYNITIS